MWFLLIIQPIVFLLLGVTTLCLGGKASKHKKHKPITLEEIVVVPNDDTDASLSETFPSMKLDVSTLTPSFSSYSDYLPATNVEPTPQPEPINEEEIKGEDDDQSEYADDSDLDSHCDSDSDIDSDSALELDSSSEGSACILDDDELSEVLLDTYDRMVVQVPPVADCNNFEDSGLEAKARRWEMRSYDWRPFWRLGEIVTQKTCELFFMKKGDPMEKYFPEKQAPMTPEERQEEVKMMEEYYRDKHVRFSTGIYQAHVIYGFDDIRGEGDFDEETMDDMELIHREFLEAEIDRRIWGAPVEPEDEDDIDGNILDNDMNEFVREEFFALGMENTESVENCESSYSESSSNTSKIEAENTVKIYKSKKKYQEAVENKQELLERAKERLEKLERLLERKTEKFNSRKKESLKERLLKMDLKLMKEEDVFEETETARDPSQSYKFKNPTDDQGTTQHSQPVSNSNILPI